MHISIPNSTNLNEVMNVRSGTTVNAIEAPQLQFNVEDKYNLAEYYICWVHRNKGAI